MAGELKQKGAEREGAGWDGAGGDWSWRVGELQGRELYGV